MGSHTRFLTLSKSFDTFLVLGSELLTPDENDDILQVRVTTVHNGNDCATNLVANMTYPPDYLVALHSQVVTLRPGDIISIGTPGAVPIAHGDTITCRIDGFLPLPNPVVDGKAINRTTKTQRPRRETGKSDRNRDERSKDSCLILFVTFVSLTSNPFGACR